MKKRKTSIGRSNIKQSEKHIVYKLTGNKNWYSELNMVQRTNIGTKNRPPTKAEITDRKSFRHKVYVWKAGKKEKRKKTRPVYSLMKGNDSIHREQSDVGTKKSKLIKTVLRCILIGLIGLMYVNNTISINNKFKSNEIKNEQTSEFSRSYWSSG